MTHQIKRVKKGDFKYQVHIESFGVKIRIVSNRPEAVTAFREVLQKYLMDFYTETEKTETAHHFLFVWNKSGRDSLYKNGEGVFTRLRRGKALEYLGSEVRRTIAEFADGRVFIHSGVVAWKGKVILIPGTSFSGKTSLTAALVKRGATYFSDEYAILDEEGFVYPFPKTLSLRSLIDRNTQIEQSAESLGGTTAAKKCRIGMVLVTEYKPYASWNPRILTPAQGIMEIVKHTVPIRRKPNLVFEVLSRAVKDAGIVKSSRGDVSKFADLILDFFEQKYL